jgi:hypothetical protein
MWATAAQDRRDGIVVRRQNLAVFRNQQVAVLKRQPPRPKLNTFDRLFWTTLRRVWPADMFAPGFY